jgi:predicted outer membrane protein
MTRNVMSRRALLLALFAPASAVGAAETDLTPPVTDEGKLNQFAALYNAYVAELRAGKLNLKLWHAVVRAWALLTK